MGARLLTLACLLIGMALGLLLQGNTPVPDEASTPMLVMFGAGEAYLPAPGSASVPAVNLPILSPSVPVVHVPYIVK